ncbi:MAG: hypothetical protein ACI4F4_10860 [Lachnospiraceae bacterium]
MSTIHKSDFEEKISLDNLSISYNQLCRDLDGDLCGQSITAPELQGVYDEVAALKDSVTEENVYSEEYLGKLLNLAGKLYFAQVDIADTIAANMYNVAVTRSSNIMKDATIIK